MFFKIHRKPLQMNYGKPPLPYWAEDPNLARYCVMSLLHGKEYKDNCRNYPGEGWLVLGKDLAWDDDIEEWVRLDKGNIANGIVGFKEDGTPVLDKYEINPFTACSVNHPTMGVVSCCDYNILPTDIYKEDISTGIFYDVTKYSEAKKKDLDKKRTVNLDPGVKYNSDDDKKKFEEKIELYNSQTIPIDKDLKYLNSYLNDITFGLEFETCNGGMPKWLCNSLGVIICRDGSIKDRDGNYPPEYVTIKLKGAKGLQTIRNLCKELQVRSDIDIKCSLHVHIGGFEVSRLFLVSLYNLCYKIQDDVFQMFPFYKIKWEHKGGDKNYCRKLQEVLSFYNSSNLNDYINESYQDLYMFLSNGASFDSDHNRSTRKNPFGEAKWNIKTRYYWVNFVNLFFGKRDTIEFRLHTPTLNSDKAINWLLMCVAIVKFAQSNVRDCITEKEVRFTDVLNYYKNLRNTTYGAQLSSNLIAYYNNRVEYFANDFENGDFLSKQELKDDANFKFNVTQIS